MSPSAVERYAAERERLLRDREPGLAAARELSALTDEVLLALADQAARNHPGRWSLLALGGYGAGRLLPASDIDLLVVTVGRSDPSAFVSALLYPLWDLGLEVGHQVRTPADHRRAVKEDLETLTSTLTGRYLAGDRVIARRVLDDSAAYAHKRRDRIRDALIGRERTGSPYLLTPDLKYGAGGRRDLDELVWTSALISGRSRPGLAPSEEAGLLTGDERASLETSQSVLAEARWRLHRAGAVPPSSMSLSMPEEAGIDAEVVQRALADVHHILMRARRRWTRARGRGPTAADRSAPDRDRGVRDRTTARDPVATVRPSGLTAREVVRLVHEDRLDELEEAAWAGDLDGLIPGMRELMTLRRPGLSHGYTVGAHSLRTATELARAAADPSDPLATSAREAVAPGVLVCAALTHDVGKRSEADDHAEAGVQAAVDSARRLGCDEADARRVGWLVRNHLLLTRVAFEHDIGDEDVILRTAERIPERALIAPLYLLTAADMRATGPDTWTTWRATLVRSLASRLDAAMDAGADGLAVLRVADEHRQAAYRMAHARGASRRVLEFLADAPARLLAGMDADELLSFAYLATALRGPGRTDDVVLRVRPTDVEGAWRVMVVTRDRPGTLSALAGAAALNGLDILEAQASTDTKGVVFDALTVRSATGAPIEHEKWAALERAMRSVTAGRLDLDARLSERRRHYPAGAGPLNVRVDRGPTTALVRVQAPDRVGLLHDITRVLSLQGFDVRFATAQSVEGVARDVFHVVDESGDLPDLARLQRLLEDGLTVAPER